MHNYVHARLRDRGKPANREEIDSDVQEVLKDFGYLSAGNKELLSKANGILVFPSVVKAGFVIGGEYGEGSLQIDGKTVNYYSIASASIGLQLGAQERAEIILFMDKNALDKFVSSDGWSAGVDGSIAVVDTGTGKGLSTETIKDPIIAIIMRNRGLMANISFEGAKISKINR
jgi:lipid-binding SYLF domain-containing protein